jgi:hypothetical protein
MSLLQYANGSGAKLGRAGGEFCFTPQVLVCFLISISKSSLGSRFPPRSPRACPIPSKSIYADREFAKMVFTDNV